MEDDSIKELSDWAASTFSDKLICSLPVTSNRKKFTKLTKEQTVAFFETDINHLALLNDLKSKVREKDISLPDMILYLDQMMEQKASSFVRIVYEKYLFAGPQGEEILLNEEEF